jgi:hypothetical protein
VEFVERKEYKNIPTKKLTPRQVAILCKEEIDQYTMAMVPR